MADGRDDKAPATTAAVVGPVSNWAVVRLPGRRFPAVALQGDTLATLRDDAVEARALLASGDVEGAGEGLDLLVQDLQEVLGFYETVLAEHGIDLPYRV